ncbi:TetR/AcrR family transcriptional regulator [Pseudonocardia acidicola]|uniref:TetR/AcrR family transcriptional regulator n=1 Tax=Pseudonocardia acidicola TaxID=2724939 RepID=A0ABX1SF68_9PSEU|nr:TetR/AcrR family transcriptional regulator [Pseudonocardia acidicola]
MTAEARSGPAPSRVARRRDRKVADILSAAADVLSERGFHGMSLDEVADRLDLTKASLYHYFPSREELVSACLETLATTANERLRQTAGAVSGTAAERLGMLIRAQLDMVVREYPQMARLFLQPLDWPELYRQRSRALRVEHDEIFRSVVREGIRSGEFNVDEDVAMHNLYGAMNNVPVWFRGRRKKDVDDMAAKVADNLLRLFLPPASSSSA